MTFQLVAIDSPDSRPPMLKSWIRPGELIRGILSGYRSRMLQSLPVHWKYSNKCYRRIEQELQRLETRRDYEALRASDNDARPGDGSVTTSIPPQLQQCYLYSGISAGNLAFPPPLHYSCSDL